MLVSAGSCDCGESLLLPQSRPRGISVSETWLPVGGKAGAGIRGFSHRVCSPVLAHSAAHLSYKELKLFVETIGLQM